MLPQPRGKQPSCFANVQPTLEPSSLSQTRTTKVVKDEKRGGALEPPVLPASTATPATTTSHENPFSKHKRHAKEDATGRETSIPSCAATSTKAPIVPNCPISTNQLEDERRPSKSLLTARRQASRSSREQSKVWWFARRTNVARQINHDNDEDDDVEASTMTAGEQETSDSFRAQCLAVHARPGAYRVQGTCRGDDEQDFDYEDTGARLLHDSILDAEVSIASRLGLSRLTEKSSSSSSTSFWCSKKVILACVVTALVMLAVLVVVVVVFIAGEDENKSKSSVEASTPTVTPTEDPWQEKCFGGKDDDWALKVLNNRLLNRKNFDEFVDVALCPNSRIKVKGIYNKNPLLGPLPPLNLQSNMRIRCGSSGSLSGQCIITGRTDRAEMLVINSKETSDETAVQNVIVEGITFEDANEHILQLFNGGDVTFRNCIFRSKRGYIPILADYKPDNDEVKIRQQVSFEGCIFEDIVFGEDRPNDSEIATMIKASHPANSITFKECVFRNIQAFRQSPGYLITSLGAEVHVERSCFYDIPEGVNPVLLLRKDDRDSMLTSKGNLVNGLWTCNSASESLGEDKTCVDLVTSSSACLAPNANLNIDW